jgi:hypothetical protein
VTGSSFNAMNERDQRDLARRLANASNVLDFERALRVVEFDSAEAERLLREHEESQKRREERARAREGMRRALREEFG